MKLLIIDTETTGLDVNTGYLIEAAFALYDTDHGLLSCRSTLVRPAPADEPDVPFDEDYLRDLLEPTQSIHGITADALLAHAWPLQKVHALWAAVPDCGVKALLAHNAEFDRQWFPDNGVPWVCTANDINWPAGGRKRRSLAALALDHGQTVIPGHRALVDVLTIVRVLDAVRCEGSPDWAKSPEEARGALALLIEDALVPGVLYWARVPYSERHKAKAAGFQWDAGLGRWVRVFRPAEARSLEIPQTSDISAPDWGFRASRL